MKFIGTDKTQDTNFCCINCLVKDTLDVLRSSKNQLVTIVCYADLLKKLIKAYSNLQEEDIKFSFAIIDFDDLDYDKEYYFSLSNIDGNCEMYIVKGYLDESKFRKAGYRSSESDLTYLYETCNWQILDSVNSSENNVLIFGFKSDFDDII